MLACMKNDYHVSKPSNYLLAPRCDYSTNQPKVKCMLHAPHLSKKNSVTRKAGGTACLRVCQFVNFSEDTRRNMQLYQ